MKTLKTLKRELLADKRTARAYADLAEEYEIARMRLSMRNTRPQVR